MIRLRSVWCCAFLIGHLATAQQTRLPEPAPSAPAQHADAPQSTPPFTLDVRTGLVVEDVSVVDKHGKPVTGLPRSSFHLKDNGVNQTLSSFTENLNVASTPQPRLPQGTFSNASLLENKGVTVAILVDNYSMNIPDQMYLRLQVHRFLDTMVPGTQVTIFRTSRSGAPILIQSLTTDRTQLAQAVDSIVPAMSRTVGSNYDNAVAELDNLAEYLRPVPGKKALLWFAGQFPLYLDPDLCNVVSPMTPTIEDSEKVVDCNGLNAVRKEAFRAMQQARVAVYPIDVRGVLVLPGLTRPPIAGAGSAAGVANMPMYGVKQRTSELMKVSGAYDLMDQLAEATGGHAFYSNNALAAAMASAVNLATQSYTLSYHPEPSVPDGKWHKIHLTVDGPYTIHYRTGYYAQETPRPPRSLLRADGSTATPIAPAVSSTPAPPNQAAPIVFTARIQPGATVSGKQSHYTVEYTIPSRQLNFSAGPDGRQQARVRLFILAYNNQGDVLGTSVDVFQTRFTPTQMDLANRIGTPAQQTIELTKGSEFLLLAVEDLQTHHVGTVQIPVKTLQASAEARSANPGH